ncbi:MAG: hypothetical protein AB7V27_03700 [Candidatus Binatia bacterium]
MPPPALNATLRAEYVRLFGACRIRATRRAEVARLAQEIAAARGRYDVIERALAVPWYVVGTIHCLECSLDFTRHLHNGDALSARTVRVPAGRPAAGHPPFSWEESASDALRLKRLDRWRDWSVGGVLYQLEAYNGWGYRLHHPEVLTPYLWGFSEHYTRGKYVADGRWSAAAVSRQCGAATLLFHLTETSRLEFAPAPGDGAPPPERAGPLIRYWTGGPEVPGARALQAFLNRMPGIAVVVDGKPGAETSTALRRVTGHYLAGDPRET